MEFSEQRGGFSEWLRKEFEAGRIELEEMLEGASSKALDVTLAFKACLQMIGETYLADVFAEVEVRVFSDLIGFGFAVPRHIDPTGFTHEQRVLLVQAMAAILRAGGMRVEQEGEDLLINGNQHYSPFEEQVEQFVAEMNDTLGPDYRPDGDGWSRWMGGR